jgi:hypothetical protein
MLRAFASLVGLRFYGWNVALKTTTVHRTQPNPAKFVVQIIERILGFSALLLDV